MRRGPGGAALREIVTFLLTFHFSLFSPDRSMVDDTSTIADIQHDLSYTLQNYMLSDNFPAHRPRVTFHVSHIL